MVYMKYIILQNVWVFCLTGFKIRSSYYTDDAYFQFSI